MSVLGFPEKLNFQSLKSMYPPRKQEYRKAPMNSQTFTTAGQDIQLVLSKIENTWYDPATLCVNFTVDYNGVSAGTVNVDGTFILGYAYSHFSRQVVRPISGQPIETIDNPSLLGNAVLNMTMDTLEKLSLSTTLGFNAIETFSNLGALIENANYAVSQSYSLPLIGCLNCAKLIPGFITDIEIDLTLNSLSNFISSVTTLANSNPTSFTIRNVELVCEAITLEESGMQQLLAAFPSKNI